MNHNPKTVRKMTAADEAGSDITKSRAVIFPRLKPPRRSVTVRVPTPVLGKIKAAANRRGHHHHKPGAFFSPPPQAATPVRDRARADAGAGQNHGRGQPARLALPKHDQRVALRTRRHRVQTSGMNKPRRVADELKIKSPLHPD